MSVSSRQGVHRAASAAHRPDCVLFC